MLNFYFKSQELCHSCYVCTPLLYTLLDYSDHLRTYLLPCEQHSATTTITASYLHPQEAVFELQSLCLYNYMFYIFSSVHLMSTLLLQAAVTHLSYSPLCSALSPTVFITNDSCSTVTHFLPLQEAVIVPQHL